MTINLPLLILPLLVLIGAARDVYDMTIPNWVSVAIAISFLPLAILLGIEPMQILTHFGFAVALLLICAVLFAFGKFGAGDAKLLSAIAFWMGPQVGLAYLFYVAISGGVLSLGVLLLRSTPLPMFLMKNTIVTHLQYAGKRGVPYGVAIAAGTLLAYPSTEIFARLTS